MDDCIKKYIENTTMCHRDLIFSDFDGSDNIKKCSCCDICAVVCNCSDCS